MAERPLLNLPDPEPYNPRPITGGGGRMVRPARGRQRARLAPKFERLARVANDPSQLLAFRADPASIAPERAIVFEVEGSVEDFYAQARAIGLEYLGDSEEEFEPSSDFHAKNKPDKKIAGRIYLAMPDVAALRELLSRWSHYQQLKKMPKGEGAWGKLFSKLIDVRPWGPQDRIADEDIAGWREDVQRAPDQPVRLEVEFWFHENAERRSRAFQDISILIGQSGGQVVHHAAIPEILYHAALVDIPAAHVKELIEHRNVELARADDIMFLRPQSVVQQPTEVDFAGSENSSPQPSAQFEDAEPIAALLDGLPIQNHIRLVNRLKIDDPDDLDETYLVAQRVHGTEMASLILHGDLNLTEPPLPRPLYVRPILRPNSQGNERTPDNRLVVDVVYQAVRRIKEGEGDEEAVAPKVVVINFSIGDQKRPFARIMSPLARLLDYLSYRYSVLFLVSAGNITDRLPVPAFKTTIEFEDAGAEEKEKAILSALNGQKGHRTLLSPAEAMNVLTVGAAHAGSAFTGTLPAARYDPYTNEDLPNVASAMGLGFKKTVKPELLFHGGRDPISIVASGDQLVVKPVTGGPQHFGLRAARPSRIGGTTYEDFTWGTSVATALATRAAHQIYDSLLDDAGGSNHSGADPDFIPLLLKALLVHSARWSNKGEMLDAFFEPQGLGSHSARRDDITRLLGYGVPDIPRVLDCTDNRATLVGYGQIGAGEGLLYRIPLPEDLDGVRALRALTVTLAWFSPVNPRHQGYRMAALDVSPATEEKYWLVPDRLLQPTDKAVARGTLFHERRQGEAAIVFVDDGHLLLRVSCRSTAGALDEQVPYALAVSFEVGVDTGIAVYDAVRTRLDARVQAVAAPAAS